MANLPCGMIKILASVFLIFSCSCSTEEEQGQVIKVIDGDTFDMKSGTEKIRVRLFGIDSPERGQAFNVHSLTNRGRSGQSNYSR
jgi:micrococcal nuclease